MLIARKHFLVQGEELSLKILRRFLLNGSFHNPLMRTLISCVQVGLARRLDGLVLLIAGISKVIRTLEGIRCDG